MLIQDDSDEEIEEEIEEERQQSMKNIGNCDLLMNPRLVFACLCGALSYFQDT